MKKYNRSEIMKRAWTLVKNQGMTISSALRKSWAEAKNIKDNVKMKGTKKQIAWANDIIKMAYEQIEWHTNSNVEDIARAGKEIKRRFDNIVSKNDDAAYFIENRERFSKTYITYKMMNSLLKKMGSNYCF